MERRLEDEVALSGMSRNELLQHIFLCHVDMRIMRANIGNLKKRIDVYEKSRSVNRDDPCPYSVKPMTCDGCGAMLTMRECIADKIGITWGNREG